MKVASRWWPRIVACTLVTGCLAIAASPASGQRPFDLVPGSAMNSVTLDLLPVAGSIGYARKLSRGAWVGGGLGAGAGAGFMVLRDEFSEGGQGPARIFVQLLHGDVFIRSKADRTMQIEAGSRVAWLYHPSTEYETRFIGVQLTALFRVGRIRLGPRLVLGHMSEEAGRHATNVGIVPLIARLEWAW
jgi:hypothetical protein